MNDRENDPGQPSGSHSMDVATTDRGLRFKRSLMSCVSDVLQKRMDTHAEQTCGEPIAAAPASRRAPTIHALAHSKLNCGVEPALFSNDGPTDEDDLAKAERRISHALNNELADSYEPHGDGATDDGRGDEREHAAPKYKNIESLLRYVESDGGQGAVKVVIMNFND